MKITDNNSMSLLMMYVKRYDITLSMDVIRLRFIGNTITLIVKVTKMCDYFNS